MNATEAAARAAFALELLAWCGRQRPSHRFRRDTPLEDALESYLRAREVDSLWNLSVGRTGGTQRLYDAAWARQLAAAREVCLELERAGLRPLVIKGGELVPAAYGEHALGFIGDVDLLMPRADMGEARRVLLGCGFRQAYFDPTLGRLVDRDVADVARIESIHYELAPFQRVERFGELDPAEVGLVRQRDKNPLRLAGDVATLVVEIDVHHNVASDVEADAFLSRAVPSHHGVGLTLSPADHLWIVLTRHYTETALHGKRSLRPFAYLVPLVASGCVDWDVVDATARELQLGPTLYYYLAFIDRLVPGVVPAASLERVHPSRTERARDWGWQLAPVLGVVDPFPVRDPGIA